MLKKKYGMINILELLLKHPSLKVNEDTFRENNCHFVFAFHLYWGPFLYERFSSKSTEFFSLRV